MPDPSPKRMTDASALRLLREIAEDSGQVIFTRHAVKRMTERRITRTMVVQCLRSGAIDEPVALDLHGNWKLTVWSRVAGRDVRAAVAIDLPSRAIVITVI
jgi:hypothetical protein